MSRQAIAESKRKFGGEWDGMCYLVLLVLMVYLICGTLSTRFDNIGSVWEIVEGFVILHVGTKENSACIVDVDAALGPDGGDAVGGCHAQNAVGE